MAENDAISDTVQKGFEEQMFALEKQIKEKELAVKNYESRLIDLYSSISDNNIESSKTIRELKEKGVEEKQKLEAKIGELQKELNKEKENRGELTRLNEANQQLTNEIANLRTSSQSDKNELNNKSTQLSTKVKEMEELGAGQHSRILELESLIKSKEEELGAARRQGQEEKNAKDVLQKLVDNFKKKIAESRKNINEKEKEVLEVRGELIKLRGEHSNKVGENNSKISDLENKIKNLEEEKIKDKSLIQQLEQNVINLQQRDKDAQEFSRIAGEQKAETEKKQKLLLKEKEELSSKLQKLEIQLADKSELESWKKSAEEKILAQKKHCEEEKNQLKAQIEEAKKKGLSDKEKEYLKKVNIFYLEVVEILKTAGNQMLEGKEEIDFGKFSFINLNSLLNLGDLKKEYPNLAYKIFTKENCVDITNQFAVINGF